MLQGGVREAVDQGLTLAELVAVVGSRSGATVATIESVLRDEVRRGHVTCLAGRYLLTGLDAETREALLLFDLPDDDGSREADCPRDPFRAGRRAATWVL